MEPRSWNFPLGTCAGFRADAPDGRIGTVEDIRFGEDLDQPDALVVRTGLFCRRFLIVSTDTVAKTVPSKLEDFS